MGKRILAGLLCALLVAVLLPKAALAAGETLMNVEAGNITIDDGNYNSNGYIITGGDPNNRATNTISVETTRPVKITLNSVHIGVNACALNLDRGANVTLTLADNTMNTLISGNSFAGVHVPTGASLIIQGGGALNAQGGGYGAGVGGNGNGEESGSITINSGTVLAAGSGNGAGIGGGGADNGDVGGSGGTISINGGTVTVVGGGLAAGIGGGGASNGGTGGSGGTITINGGKVDAYGSGLGAGIGGGGASQLGIQGASGTGGLGGVIKINGGTVSALNGYSTAGNPDADQFGAAIGGGASPDKGRNNGSVDLSGYAQYEWAHTDTNALPTAFTLAPYPANLQNAHGYTIIRPAPGGPGGAGGDVGADVPKTGDDAPLALLCGLIALCGAGLIVRKRRGNCERRNGPEDGSGR